MTKTPAPAGVFAFSATLVDGCESHSRRRIVALLVTNEVTGIGLGRDLTRRLPAVFERHRSVAGVSELRASPLPVVHPVRPPLLTAKQVAGLLGVSDVTVRTRARSGDLPSLRVRHHVRFDQAELFTWLASRHAGWLPGRASGVRSLPAPLVRSQRIAELLEVSDGWVRKQAQAGHLPSWHLFGGVVRFSEAEVMTWLEAHRATWLPGGRKVNA
jgi:excisionase family DNA binding protein